LVDEVVPKPMTTRLSRLLSPGSIAFIGGAECEVAIRQTRGLAYAGEIFAVHPKRSQLAGIACVRSVDELPLAPDVAFVAVRRELAVEVVSSLAARGAGAAVVYASGFSETGSEGQHLQDLLLKAARGMPLVGPNCYGFVNYLARAALWPDEHGGTPRDKGVAILTQSGNMAINFTMTKRALPLAAVFSLGNQADVDIAAMLEALVADERITAVGVHLEALKDPARFARAAEAARLSRKPVVALKTGRSEQGAKVAMSHTNSLAGSDTLYDALFERCGVARVHSITAFVETLKFLHHGGPLSGNRVVSMSCSGGEAALVADMAEQSALRFPPFSEAARAKVAATLNDYVAIDNPLDYHTFIWNHEEKLLATFSAVLSGGFDIAMLILDIPTVSSVEALSWRVAARAFLKAQEQTGVRAALVASLPECLPEDFAALLSAAGIAPMAGLDDALTAFEAAAAMGRNWALPGSRAPIAVQPRAPSPARLLSEYDAKKRLERYGLAVPPGILCRASDAPDAAARLGYPVAVKIAGEAVAHKTEHDGVALDLRVPEAVASAARRLATISDELLVERMITGAVCELIIGVKADPQFGLALVIGAGGILTELLNDAATLLLPARRDEIEHALGRLKVAKLIDGYRGRSGDRQAAIRAIEAVARFAEAHASSLEELDVNPLLVLPPGQGAVAVDALIRLREKRDE
jgi:acetate---CoA ligase (ADP-forming)